MYNNVDYCAWDGCRGHSSVVLTYTSRPMTGAILLAKNIKCEQQHPQTKKTLFLVCMKHVLEFSGDISFFFLTIQHLVFIYKGI